MILEKNIIVYRIIWLSLVAIFLTMPKYSHSKENVISSPLHIKITPNINNKKNIINIISGKTPVDVEPTHTKEAKKPVSRKINVDNILSSISCRKKAKDISKDAHTGKAEKLADSLKLYFNNKHQTEIIDTLYNSSKDTGVDFELLVITAMIESNFGKNYKSETSSARGVFQYIEPTWLALIKKYGDRIGYKSYANAIIIDKETKLYTIANNNILLRQEILDLRNNNYVSTMIKSYQIIDENKVIRSFKNGQTPDITDHYIAHMLGLTLAKTFYKLHNGESGVILANIKIDTFKEAVRLNKGFFYDKNGTPINANKSYYKFKRKITEKLKFLHYIDAKYGSGENVTSSTCPNNIPKRLSQRKLNAYKKSLSVDTKRIIRRIRLGTKTTKVNMTIE